MLKISDNRIDTDEIQRYYVYSYTNTDTHKLQGYINIYFKGDSQNSLQISYKDGDELLAIARFLDKKLFVKELKYVQKEVVESQIELIDLG